jgi:hypothetical protein
VAKSFLVELKDKMKHKFKLIKQENEKIAEVSKLIRFFGLKKRYDDLNSLLRSL